MSGRFLRQVLAAMAAACLWSTACAQPRSLTVDDVVALEAFGRASIAPNGRWAIYEKRGPYDTAPRFDMGPRSQWAIMDLWLVDLFQPGHGPERLLPHEPVGLVQGPWSPRGDRLLIYRLRGGALEIGVVTLADQSVLWTGLTPDMPMTGSAAQWISDDRIVLLTRPDRSLPWLLRYYGDSQAATVRAWARTASGRSASRTVIDTAAGVAFPEGMPSPRALIRFDVPTSATLTLADGLITDFSVSPDASRIAMLMAGEPTPIGRRNVLQADVPHRHRLKLADLDGEDTSRPSMALDVAPHLLRWSPNSKRLLVWAREDGERWSDGDLVQVDGRGVVSVFNREDLMTQAEGGDIDILRGVRADWVGDEPVLYGRRPGEDRFDWHLLSAEAPPRVLTRNLEAPPATLAARAEGSAYFLGDGALWVADAAGAERLTGPDQSLTAVSVTDIEKPFRLKQNDAPNQAWVTASTAPGDIVTVATDGRVRTQGRISSQGRVMAIDRDAMLTLERSGLVETLRLTLSGQTHELDVVNSRLASTALIEPVMVRHADAAGRETTSQLFLPNGQSDGSVRGLVVQIYPGSVDTGVWSGPLTLTFGVRAAVLAGMGYAVLSPSIPIDSDDARSATFYEQSVDLALDAALTAYPELPEDRIAIFGHSFGGHAALAIASRSTRYSSYVVWAAPTDLFGTWGEFQPVSRILPEDGVMLRMQQGGVEAGQSGLSGPPWSRPEAYIDASPYLAAGNITAPVLLITADRDFVPMSQSERIFSVLHRQGGRARLVTYWGEDHSLWSPGNIRDLYEQILGWLDATMSSPTSITANTLIGHPTPSPSPRRRPPS